jgi:hypothetical protein
LLRKLAKDKHSSVFGPFVSCEENVVLRIQPLKLFSKFIYP